MKSIHFKLQSILLLVNVVLFVIPLIGLLFTILTGAVQVLHSLCLLTVLKQRRYVIQLLIHLGIAAIYLFLICKAYLTDFTFIAITIPVLLALFFWGITVQVNNEVKHNLTKNEIDNFLQPNNNII